MNGRYLYQVGDKVRHFEHVEKVGEIVQLLSEDGNGEPKDVLDTTNPWYLIKWETDGFVGFEHEHSLVPEWTNPIPFLVITELYNNYQSLWKRLVEEVK